MENQALLENIKDQWSFKARGESRTKVFDQLLKEGEELKKCDQVRPDVRGKGQEVCNLWKH